MQPKNIINRKVIQIILLSLSFLFITGFSGCSEKHSTPAPQVKYIQSNVIHDPVEQLKLVNDALQANYLNSYYVYDSKRWGEDHWDNTYSQLEEAYSEFKQNMGIEKDAKQDCEDTALTLSIFLIKHGFPYNQLELYFCLVPKDTAGNTSETGWVGHAIVITYIDGMQPLVLEQLPMPRKLSTMYNQYGYRFVAGHSFEDPIDVWYEADQEIIDFFANGGIFTMDMLQGENNNAE